MAVAGLCLSLARIVGFVPLVCAGPGAGPNGFELTFHVAGLVVLNVSPVWVSCGWSVRPLPALCCVVLRWRPYRVECTGSLPTSEVKRRRARLVLGGTAREDLRVLPAFCQPSSRCREVKRMSFRFARRIPAQREVHAMVSPMWLDACVCLCGMLTLVPVCLGARQLN